MKRTAVFLTAFTAAVFMSVGWAQAADTGVLNAVAYGPVKAGSMIDVRALDNSDVNLRLEKVIEQELTARGYQVSDGAPLQMNFDTIDDKDVWKGSTERRRLEFGGSEDKARKEATRETAPSRLRLEFSLDDRTNGKSLWRGWGVAEVGRRDATALTRAMVPLLVENIGLTVRQKAFPLP